MEMEPRIVRTYARTTRGRSTQAFVVVASQMWIPIAMEPRIVTTGVLASILLVKPAPGGEEQA
jgi:hypothetical protein